MEEEKKKSKVKRGSLAVRVGLEGEEGGFQKFVIPISHLYHPFFRGLLEKARDVYGFHTKGSLKLPCSVDDFLHACWLIEHESQHRHPLNSFSFHPC